MRGCPYGGLDIGAVRRVAVLMGGLLAGGLLAPAADAQYFRKPISDLDPTIMRIDERKFLGARLDGNTSLIGEGGEAFPLSDLFGKPLILVFAYYTCDGSCSLINSLLYDLLGDVQRVRAGEDFRILTLSFDRHDNPETTAAFRRHLGIGREFAPDWTFATFKNERELEAQTAKVGFKFFWSAEDRIFLHPGAFLFLSAEGRLVRVLYPPNLAARDVELAVLDATQGRFRPQEIVNFAVSLCYSYNYKEGKYTLSIPVFVGLGALLTGLSALLIAVVVFKSKKRRLAGDMGNARIA